MDNLKIYNSLREVPQEAKKTIEAGRLKGMTDINPMWRIKALTEQFGACGEGWYPQLIDKQVYEANGEVVATVDINLYYKLPSGEWSKPIFGTGGSKLVAKESKGLYVNDEAFKMAYTDAISVCGKELGLGADVYWDKDNTKYNDNKKPQEDDLTENKPISARDKKIIIEMAETYGKNVADICRAYKVSRLDDLTTHQYGSILMQFKKIEDRKNG